MRRALVVAILLSSAGCIFAPPKYGSTGVAIPGSSQYDLYLQNCKARYPELVACCEKWGAPSAIQIGNSGGYFVWRGQQQWLRAKSFGAQIITSGHPKMLRPYVDDGSAQTAVSAAPARTGRNAMPLAGVNMPLYRVEKFERTADDDFAYVFRLRLKDGADAGISSINKIKNELRLVVVADYVAAYGGNVGDVKVDLPEFSQKDDLIEGRAEVMRIAVQSLVYNAETRKGLISVKVGANRIEDARKWVRKNIETLAKDKNVALTTGQVPSEARFYLGAERIKDGNLLEIEFETE